MALRDINLIAPETLDRRYRQRHLLFWGVTAALVLAVMTGGYLGYMRWGIGTQAVQSTPDGVQRRLEAKLAEVQELKQSLENLRDQQAGLVDLAVHLPFHRSLVWVHDSMPRDAWLNRLAVENIRRRRALHQTLELQGLAASRRHLGELLERLADHPGIARVELILAKEGALGAAGAGERRIAFEIHCRVKGASA